MAIFLLVVIVFLVRKHHSSSSSSSRPKVYMTFGRVAKKEELKVDLGQYQDGGLFYNASTPERE